MPNNVITIKWGDLYGPHYVNRLYSAARRNLTGDFRFVCFTDDSENLQPEIATYPIPDVIDPKALSSFANGRKQQLFQSGIGELEGPCLFFDLDVIIVDSIDCFFDYKPGEFCICKEWLPPHQVLQYKFKNRQFGGNSSVFRFEANSMQFVIDMMNEDVSYPQQFRLEQRWLSHVLRDHMVWWPDEWVKSFKHRRPVYPFSFLFPPVLPQGARVMVFNGPLKQSHAINGNYELSPRRVCRPASWAAEHWID